MPHSNILRNILVIALINLSLVVAIFDFDKFFAGTAPSPQLIHTKAVYTNTKADQGSNQILGLTDSFPTYEFCNLVFENRLVSPDSILEVVDKENMLPADYMPSDLHTLDASKYNVTRTIQLRESAYNSLIPMLNDMNAANLEYAITSGYRSYTTQQYAFNYWARYVGLAEAGGFVSAPIYASVSGTVKAIAPHLNPTGGRVNSIVIENDGEVPVWRAIDWQPLELSAVPIGADQAAPAVGVPAAFQVNHGGHQS